MNNLVPQPYSITRILRSELKGHKPYVVWFIGLSGSGKSTIANAVEKKLFHQGIHTYTLDGDNIRGGLNKNLGFSKKDRAENIRRIAEVSKLFLDAGNVVLSAFITPLESDRETVRKIIGLENYLEIFVKASVEECEKRDVKGLYKKARQGEIKDFTGISAPFEVPLNPDVILDTEAENIEESARKVLNHIISRISIKENE